jgi:hypothetical protein
MRCIWSLSETEGSNNRACESVAYKSAAEYRAVLPSSNATTMALSNLSDLMIRGSGRFSIRNCGMEAQGASVFQRTVIDGQRA